MTSNLTAGHIKVGALLHFVFVYLVDYANEISSSTCVRRVFLYLHKTEWDLCFSYCVYYWLPRIISLRSSTFRT